ncbi:hypothetical protein H6P81_005371 [Aristolochia fimbriata]|uniref:RNase H type-1 domain-containing protein n=1 Tax=Aristolochia fimbriata TaxID=158543 RepID=A0AAV7EUE0_ARIFI|nr:hypothetical protein H6P81_005371 [Aristolochia fimbriata]
MGTAPLRIEINFAPRTSNQRASTGQLLGRPPGTAEWELTEEFPDEEIFLVEVLPPWEMYRPVRCSLEEVEPHRVLFVSPKKDLLPYSFVLTQACSNNEAEYQAILLGLGMAVEMQIPQLHIYGDSALAIKQQLTLIRGRGVTSPQKRHTVGSVGHTKPPKTPFANQTTRLLLAADARGRHRNGSNRKRVPAPCRLHTPSAGTTSPDRRRSWPFEAWGWTSLVPSLLSPTDRRYILAATDYFSKWAKLLLTEK